MSKQIRDPLGYEWFSLVTSSYAVILSWPVLHPSICNIISVKLKRQIYCLTVLIYVKRPLPPLGKWLPNANQLA